MIRVNVASALIFDESNENIVMVKNKKGDTSYWSLPGGAVEAGETLEEAAKREVREESGFEVELSGLASVREAFFKERGSHALLFTFYANIVGGDMRIEDPDLEIEEVRWMSLEEANHLMNYLPAHLKPSRTKNSIPYYFHGEA